MQEDGDRYEALKASIRLIFDRHKGRYGYRRVTAQLRQDGSMVNHKLVQRLMQELGLKSLVRPKKYCSYLNANNVIAENLLDRRFQAALLHKCRPQLA